jgi:hypothetical protein
MASTISDFLSSHIDLMPPVLQPAVGKPVKALKSVSTTEWMELGPLDCRSTNLLAAAFTEGADYNTRHEPLRDRLHVEARASGIGHPLGARGHTHRPRQLDI